MMYTTKCSVCRKKGNRGVFSHTVEPDGWIMLSWMSKHSQHIEVVCSPECLTKFEFHEDNLPKKKSL